jgi:ABC-type transporter Mla MlaB component
VAFSLFGKKPTVPAPTTKVPKQSGARPEEPSAGQPDDELVSLDFTHPGDMPASSKKSSRIQVQEVGQQVPAAVEQAAMLYSAEQTGPACSVLEAAIRQEDLGRFTQRAWGMLFDLYQQSGRKPDFETLALEYAARFESSPPAWSGPDGQAAQAASVSRSGASLAGMLDLKIQEQLKQMLKFAEKNPSVRLDVAKITDANDQGCALLASALRQLKKQRKECALVGAEKLAAILAKKIVPGTRERENTWLLLLELYQQLFAQEAFEEAAVNYAVTFEVSPPSWEPPKAKPAAAGAGPNAEATQDACALEGDIVGADESAFVALRVRAESADEVVVDVSRLRRMDFVAAATLMNVVAGLAAAKKNVRFVKASHLITALWEILGLDRVARIETRKT